MKYWRIGIAVACSAGLSTMAAARVGADLARQQVLDLERQWVAAENKHTEAILRRILDDKFVATFTAGKTYNKEDFLKDELAGNVDPTQSQSLSDEIVVVDGDTAVIVGTDTFSGTRNGSAYTVVGRYTTTYIRRGGRWFALAEQIAKLPQAK